MTRALVAAAITVALVAGSVSAATPVKATLTVTDKTPAVGAPWRWTVKTTSGGKPAKATVRIQILFGTMVVGCWKGGKMQRCTGAKAGDQIHSKGAISKPVRWTAESRHVPLTFRAIVTSGGKTRTLKTTITVE